MHAKRVCLHAIVFAVLLMGIGQSVTAADFAFAVRSIEVPLTVSHVEMLTKPTPVVPPCGEEEALRIVWRDGELTSLSDQSFAMDLQLDLVPGASIAVDETVQTLLANVSGQLSIDSQDSAQVWRIRQENYSSQYAKVTYVPDGRVIASLPVRMSQDPTAETAFGHLAVFCSYAGGETLRCDGVKVVFSNGVATSRGQQRTIERVLSDVLESD